MLLAVDVACQILCGPTDLEQHLLDAAALAVVHHNRVVVDARAKHRRDLLVAQDFFEQRAVQTDQGQAVNGALHQLQPAVAGHHVDDVDEQRLRHRVEVVPGCAGVPQRQRGDAVRVDVFRRTLQLGERGDRGARRTGLLMVDFKQHCLVGLHDQGAVGHPVHYPDAADTLGFSASRTIPLARLTMR